MSDYPDRDPQLMYELATQRLATQLECIDAVDAKLATLVSLSSALVGIAAAVVALRATSTEAGSFSGWDIGVLVVGGVAYLAVAVVGIFAYFSRDWDSGPQLDPIWKQHETTQTDAQIKWGVANDCLYAFEENEPKYVAKANALDFVLVGTVIETVVVVSALVLMAVKA